ncbi:MAG: hypothetical protein E7L17_07525 [Clostridium sp.]|uniref:hypothetical protein n=1 Tax=Clostridium sp. TaxID=1506 RepID=UPI002910FD62|nr:hypothetical protein [Clostridium sp.]MDU7337946.1 hypothetical protein [Clostridium sp.]
MNYIKNGNQEVVMGSGDLYAIPVKEIADVFNLTEAEEAKLTYLGYIEANSVLKSEIEKEPLKSANAGLVGEFIKEKTNTFQTGIFSWNLENISNFLTGSTYTVDETTGKTIFSYAHEDKSPNVYLRFVSTDEAAKKKIVVNMFTCAFNGELNFDFNLEKPVTFDYAFTIIAQLKPSTGKHVYYEVSVEDLED